MKYLPGILIFGLLAACSTTTGNWKTVDEGFRFFIPSDWQNQDVIGVDSHAGEYRGKTGILKFDEVQGLPYYTNKDAQAAVMKLEERKTNPKLLTPNEEVWHLDGRIAHFSYGNVTPVIYGNLEFINVAELFVPYPGKSGYLLVHIWYKDESALPVVRRILASIEWRK